MPDYYVTQDSALAQKAKAEGKRVVVMVENPALVQAAKVVSDQLEADISLLQVARQDRGMLAANVRGVPQDPYDSGRNRNSKCPCGSGKKVKNCKRCK